MTADDFRRLALALEGVSEGAHMGHADFRVNGRIFATLGYPSADRAMTILTPDEQAMRMEAAPEVFEPAAGALGRKGSTLIRLDAADEATLAGALTLAWRLKARAPPPRKRKV